VELFVKGDQVWFSEVSPRPHDTGLVTLVGQELSQFALHARAILDLPVPEIRNWGPAASCAVLAHGHGVPAFSGVEAALAEPGTMLRLFGKPRVDGHRRVGVTLARGSDIEGRACPRPPRLRRLADRIHGGNRPCLRCTFTRSISTRRRWTCWASDRSLPERKARREIPQLPRDRHRRRLLRARARRATRPTASRSTSS
jgi:hypothetical protein